MAAVLADATAEAMGEAVAGERGTGNGEREEDGASRPSQKSQTSRDEITQEQAEKLYEEIMAK